MTLPNFLIVGAAKSGTTSLYHYLNQHPGVFMARDKEPHHFAPAKWCGHPPLDRVAYERLFRGANKFSAIGEASTGYLYYDESPQLIFNAIPDCRIVIILRDPVDRAFSGYCHELREGIEKVSFEEALAEESRATRIIRGGEFSFNYFKQSVVCELIKHYIALFTRERVHICLFDDLLRNPDDVMCHLFRFLGVDENYRGDWSYRYNPSGIPRFQWLHKLVDGEGQISKSAKMLLEKLDPASVREPMWHRIRDWNIHKGPGLTLNKDTRDYLRRRFEQEVLCLESLLERDLSHWRN